MKTIGLIGGMSWESTIPYYTIINEYVKEKLGGLHSAKIVLFSLDLEEIASLQAVGEWDKCAKILADAAKKLELAGAELILICTNTQHKVFDQVQASVKVPLLHIVDATASELKKNNVKTVALLGTKYTLREAFYKQRLVDAGFKVLIPDEEDIELVNHIIFDELCLGIINNDSKIEMSRIISDFKDRGAEALILGCTEIGLLVQQQDSILKTFDTTEIHAKTAAHIALNNMESSNVHIRETNGIVVFQSDFGLKDGAVSEMKGVALSVDQTLRLFDITHEIPAFNILDASYRLYQAYKYWPNKTVFVSVVDPGVGSERLSVVAKMKNGSYVITPDNGTLTYLANDIEEIKVIDEASNRLPGSENNPTFHGRDIYAYTAARLACGVLMFDQVGDVLKQKPVLFEYTKACIQGNQLTGIVETLDVQYGNVWSNIDINLAKQFKMESGKEYNVLIKHGEKTIFNSKMKYLNTFSDVLAGEPLIYLNSLRKISLAINNGNFADSYGISYGDKWFIVIQ